MKTMQCLWFFTVGLITFPSLWAQKGETEAIFYREDQLYFGLNYLVVQSQTSAFELQGLSSQFQFGVLRDIPLHANGRWAVALGLGFERTNIRSNSQWEGTTLRYTPNTYRTYSYQGLSIPIEFRWRSSTPTKYAFWRIYSGVKWKRNWAVGGATPSDVLRPWVPSVYTAIGYNTWNLYFSTTLQSIYRTEALIVDQGDIGYLALGLVFFLF